MKNFFQAIKKKKNKRRLSALWLFLMIMEVFCPVLCDKPALAATTVQLKSQSSAIERSGGQSSDQPGIAVKKSAALRESISQANSQSSDDDSRASCDDSCTCHGAAFTSIDVLSAKEFVLSHERIVSFTTDPVIRTLSPPHQPPKIS